MPNVYRFAAYLFIFFTTLTLPTVSYANDCLTHADPKIAHADCLARLTSAETMTLSQSASLKRSAAQLANSLGNFEEALHHLDELSEIDAADPDHHYQRAVALLALTREAEAKNALDKALDLDPFHQGSLQNRAEMALESGDPQTAISDAGLLAMLVPDDLAANNLMAEALAAVGANEAAARSAEIAEAATEVATEEIPVDKSTQAQPEKADESPSINTNEVELVFWNDVKDTKNPAELEVFVEAFPNSVFRSLAQVRIQELQAASSNQAKQVETTALETERATLPDTLSASIRWGEIGPSEAISTFQMQDGSFLIGGALGETSGKTDGLVSHYDRDGKLLKEETIPSQRDYFGAVSNLAALPDGKTVAFHTWSKSDYFGHASSEFVILDSDFRLQARFAGPDVIVDSPPGFLVPLADGGWIFAYHSFVDENKAVASVTRYTATAEAIWTYGYNAAANAAIFDMLVKDDRISLLGSRKEDLEIDPFSAFFVQLDLNGKVLTTRELDRASTFVAGMSIRQGKDKELDLIVSEVDSERDLSIKRLTFSSEDQLIDEKAMTPSSINGFHLVKQTPDGGYIAAGSVFSSEIIDGWVTSLEWFDQDHELVKRKVFNNDKRTYITNITTLHDGGLVLAGRIELDRHNRRQGWLEIIPPISKLPSSFFDVQSSSVWRDCASLSAHPQDDQNPFNEQGNSWEDFEPATALSACRLAATAFPENGLMQYGAGRTYHKSSNFKLAEQYYQKASQLGHVRADLGLSVVYGSGSESIKDERKSFEYAERAMKGGDMLAAHVVGEKYEAGDGVSRDLERAFAAYVIAADAGFPQAQLKVARAYRNGAGVRQSYLRAEDYFKRAAEQGEVLAQYEYASLLEFGAGDIRLDAVASHRWYLKAAEKGHAQSMLKVARNFDWGNNNQTIKSKVLARQWYQRAYDAGEKTAASNLAYFYETGIGGVKGTIRAVQLYEEAEKQGNGFAISQLGVLYYEGRGVTKNIETAYDHFRRAADKNVAFAARRAGWMLYNGEGVSKDVSAAVSRLRQAIDGNNEYAKVLLAFVYESESDFGNDKLAARLYFEALRDGIEWPTQRTAREWNRGVARELQKKLKASGHYTGAIDGSMGPGSVRAMKALCKCG